jgi:GntR family transcriptional regulator
VSDENLMANKSLKNQSSADHSLLATPLYHRVYTALRQKLMDGTHAQGEPLPGEPTLALQYGVARVTVRRALAQLEAEGLVRRKPGAGTFASKPAGPKSAPRENLGGWLDPVLAAAEGTGARELAIGRVKAPARVALALALRPLTMVLRIERVRTRKGLPFIHTVIYIPESHAAFFENIKLDTRTTTAILEQSGVPITTVDQVISATACDGASARALGIAVGAPLILVKRVLRDDSDTPVEYFESVYLPDHCEYRQSLRRMPNGQGADGAHWAPLG